MSIRDLTSQQRVELAAAVRIIKQTLEENPGVIETAVATAIGANEHGVVATHRDVFGDVLDELERDLEP